MRALYDLHPGVGTLAQRWAETGAHAPYCVDLVSIAQAIADAYDRGVEAGIAAERARVAAEHGDVIARHVGGEQCGGVGSINPEKVTK